MASERVVSVVPIEQNTPLHTWWVTRNEPHAAYLLLNLENGALKLVDASDPLTRQKPLMSPWNMWRVGPLGINDAYELLHDVAPLAQKALDGCATERNVDGSWTRICHHADAALAMRQIAALCETPTYKKIPTTSTKFDAGTRSGRR